MRDEERRRHVMGLQPKCVQTTFRFQESCGWVNNSATRRSSIEQASCGPRESDSLPNPRLLTRSGIQPNLPGSSDLAHHVIGTQHTSERATPPCQWTDPI